VLDELDLTYNDFFFETYPERDEDYICSGNDECTYKNRDNILITRAGVLRLANITQSEERVFDIKMWIKKICDMQHKKILGITMSTLNEITKVMTDPISCLYLVKLCRAKEFKKYNKGFDFIKKMNDDTPIYKYGGTEDLHKELSVEAKRYSNIRIIKYVPVHKKYIDEAKTDAKRDFVDSRMKISRSKTDTHLIIPYDKLTDVCSTSYDAINRKYKTKTSEAIDIYDDAWDNNNETIESLRDENKKLIEKLNKINKVSMC
jgi:hypothetical protein